MIVLEVARDYPASPPLGHGWGWVIITDDWQVFAQTPGLEGIVNGSRYRAERHYGRPLQDREWVTDVLMSDGFGYSYFRPVTGEALRTLLARWDGDPEKALEWQKAEKARRGDEWRQEVGQP